MSGGNMVERVARALCAFSAGPEGSEIFQRAWSGYAKTYREEAIVAIGAMREPTQEMLDAASEEDCRQHIENSVYANGAEIWPVMIDAALEEDHQHA